MVVVNTKVTIFGLTGILISYILYQTPLLSVWSCSRLRPLQKPDTDGLVEQGTSVTCQGRKHTERQCHFSNLCYIPHHQNFAFLHSQKSNYVNLPADRLKPALLDLSSVEDHNQHYFNYVDLPSEALRRFDAVIDDKYTLVFNRFLPTNLMHALHDDILPAYDQMRRIAQEYGIPNTGIQLLFLDDMPNHDFESLYNVLSDQKPVTKSSLFERNITVCFQDVFVGIPKSTLWYQYGFKTFQGHVSNAFHLSPNFFPEFREFVASRLKLKLGSSGDYLVLVSRKDNRRIINEGNLIMGLAKFMKVVVVSLEDFRVERIVEIVTSAKGLIGMHGSLLSLAVFLPEGSVLIELFPYAIPPENYTPYRTISKLPGLRIVYRSWANDNLKNTVVHPDWEPEFGGIHHLPEAEQYMIKNNHLVMQHLCCSDPNWLYRIYQDTVVNVNEIVTLTSKALEEAKVPMKQIMLPALVKEIECYDENITWHEPWNLRYILKSEDEVQYEVWLQNPSSEDYESSFTREQFLKLNNLPSSVEYYVWVRCLVNDVAGPFSGYRSCSFPPSPDNF